MLDWINTMGRRVDLNGDEDEESKLEELAALGLYRGIGESENNPVRNRGLQPALWQSALEARKADQGRNPQPRMDQTPTRSPSMGGLGGFGKKVLGALVPSDGRPNIGHHIAAAYASGRAQTPLAGAQYMNRVQDTSSEAQLEHLRMRQASRMAKMSQELSETYPDLNMNDPNMLSGAIQIMMKYQADPMMYQGLQRRLNALTAAGVDLQEVAQEARANEAGAMQRLEEEGRKDIVAKVKVFEENVLQVYREAEDAFVLIEGSLDTGLGDTALINAFVKVIDPGSVVRESETGAVRSVVGLGSQLTQAINNTLKNNVRLHPDVRKQIIDQAKSYIQKRRENVNIETDNKKKDLYEVGAGYGVPNEFVDHQIGMSHTQNPGRSSGAEDHTDDEFY